MTWYESAEESRSRAAMSEWDRTTDAPSRQELADDEWLAGIPHDRPRDMAQEAADVARLVDLQAGQRAAAECDCGHGWEYHGPEVPGCVECRCRLLHSGVGVVLNEGTAGAA